MERINDFIGMVKVKTWWTLRNVTAALTKQIQIELSTTNRLSRFVVKNSVVKHYILHTAAKKAFDNQREEAKREKEVAKRHREEEKERMKAQIDDLKGQGKRREARKLHARMLGLDSSDEELDSDIDPDGCEEFDSASDSSLVPPWMIDD